jgi:hypothetical protein
MLDFLLNKKVIVKRYSNVLGQYNRPQTELIETGTYPCFVSETSSNTAQKQPQKETTTDLTLYTDVEADILMGDVLYIYETDEYGNIIQSSELKALADKPYKKRTHLSVSLLSVEEV